MSVELYKFIGHIHMCVVGIVYVLLLSDVVVRWSVSFVNDEKFNINGTYMLKIGNALCRGEGYFTGEGFLCGVYFIISLFFIIHLCMIWPVLLLGGLLTTILISLRFVVRTKKKFKKLARYTHGHKNKDEFIKVEVEEEL